MPTLCHRRLSHCLAVIALLVISGVPAFAQTPVPVQDPTPRPVPVTPDEPPPTGDKPYPVPVPVDPPPAPPATPDKPPAPADKPVAPPKPPARQPAAPPPGADKPLSPPGASLPGAPPATGPGTIPPGKLAPAPIATPAPVLAPTPVTTTKVIAYPQSPLVGTAKVKKIVVVGNSKTDTDTVILISKVDVGDDWSVERQKEVERELESCGLFKEITVYWSNVEGGVQIHLLVKDKHSWIIAPAFYTQPTNVGGGLGFGENNLFGQNQKLVLYGQIATGDTFFIGAWVIPSLGGTRFYAQLDTFLKSQRNIEYASPDGYIDGAEAKAVRESRMHYLNGGVKLGIELVRGFKIDSRFRAAKVSFQDVKLAEGATEADVGVADGMAIPAPGGEGWDISNEWTASIDRRANYHGIQTGYRVGVSFERAIESLSDFKYTLTGLSLYRAKQVFERHNFIVKASVNYGRDVPFQQEYSIGGPSMRGYINSQFRGDFKALANIEYSVPLITIKGVSMRGLAFFDSGYTTFLRTRPVEAQRHYLPGAEARGTGPFKNSVGLGTRLNVRQIVLPLLGLDFGYGLEARDFQIYLAVGLTD